MDRPLATFDEFHLAAGKALAEWAAIEDAFRDLFSRLVICSVTRCGALEAKPDGFWVLGSVFYSSTNFRARLDLLDRIIRRLVLDKNILGEWNAVKNKATRLYARRNILAHGHVYGNLEGGASCMAYSIFDDSKRQDMNYVQICAATPSFARYKERVNDLAIAANKHLASRKRDPEQLAH